MHAGWTGVETGTGEGRGARARAPTEAEAGKSRPAHLPPLGRRRLALASAAVREVELRMLAGLGEDDRAEALRLLRSMADALG